MRRINMYYRMPIVLMLCMIVSTLVHAQEKAERQHAYCTVEPVFHCTFTSLCCCQPLVLGELSLPPHFELLQCGSGLDRQGFRLVTLSQRPCPFAD